MNRLLSTKASYVAAFLLGCLMALIAATPVRSAEPFRLDRVAIVQFTAAGEGMLRRHDGVLFQDGRVVWRTTAQEVPRPANTPDWAIGQNLITNAGWHHYRALASSALDNFELIEGAIRFEIGNESYHFIAANPFGYLATGRVANLSTRTRIAGDGEVIAGFVIEDQPRTLLIRGVGPGLASFGVSDPHPDPYLSIKRGGQTLQFNDNWSGTPDAEVVRQATARVGAFALDEGSADAASVVVLPPGVYTVHVRSAQPDSAGGEVLVELYSVPDEVWITETAVQG